MQTTRRPFDRFRGGGRLAKARPPELMPADISLRDLTSWRRAWDDFAELEQLNRFTLPQQRAMLRTSLSIDMRSTLHLAIGIDNDDDVSVSEILDQIHEYVRAKRNVTLDRVALEERKQEDGETFDQFYIALREIANNADLCQTCIDDRLTTRIMSGIRDPETRRKLLAHTHLRRHCRRRSISAGVKNLLVKTARRWLEAGISTRQSNTFDRKRDHAMSAERTSP